MCLNQFSLTISASSSSSSHLSSLQGHYRIVSFRSCNSFGDERTNLISAQACVTSSLGRKPCYLCCNQCILHMHLTGKCVVFHLMSDWCAVETHVLSAKCEFDASIGSGWLNITGIDQRVGESQWILALHHDINTKHHRSNIKPIPAVFPLQDNSKASTHRVRVGVVARETNPSTLWRNIDRRGPSSHLHDPDQATHSTINQHT